MLTVGKSGDDIVLSWTGTGTLYDGARASDAPFTDATTQFTGFGGTSHTYIGALSNPRNLEFFDVTDETESNRGGNWNGGVLPPPPPVIDAGDPSTNIGSLFIGSLGTIVGTGFSIIPETNAVCFNGGVCTEATSASSTQIQFVTPPGAQTGRVTVTVGGQSSESATSTVTLEDPASGWLIRTIGFSRQNKSYWMAGTASAVNSLYRVFYNTGTGKWSREDRGGPFSGNSHFCSTQTSRTGRLFCGLSTLTTGGGGARVVETEPPSNLASCINLGGAGNNSNVRGAAADPNPAAAGGRDVAYFAHAIDSVPASYRIKKVAADCSAILDSDFGNTNWSGLWNAIVGMAVDPVTGDLYIAAKTDIYRVAPDESVQLVKGGFTSVNGIDVAREGANDPGVLLVADGGTSNTVKAVPLDNTGAAPITVATASILRASTFGALVSGGPWLATTVNRTIVIHNNGNSGAVDPIRPHPLVEVTPVGPFEVRISSPSVTEQLPVGQSRMRPSTFGDTSFSHAVTELRYRDGLSRFTCAWAGDPGAGAPQYDPVPAVPSDCNKPRTHASAICDNVDDIVAGGPGSFVEAGNPIQSCKTCGGTLDPCVWEFRITNRFGGDNYKVYFAFDQSSERFAATSDVYTAWKHVHVERERMCNVGGILFQDYGATGQCGGAGQPACCGTGGEPPCNQIVLYDASNISMGDSLVVFDELNPYETAGYARTVTAPPVNNGNGSVTLTLDSSLPQSYRASMEHTPIGASHVPDFVNGHSGGVCVPSGGFVEADLSDLRQGFDHALVDYHVPTYGLHGSGVVPTLWPAFFDLVNRPCATFRFSQVWNSRALDSGTAECLGPDAPANGVSPNNVLHAIPAFDTLNAVAGFSAFQGAFSYILDDQIAQDCAAATSCTAPELDAMRRWTVAHEKAHHFQVNKCSAGGHDTRDAWCGSPGGACVIPPATDQSCVMEAGISVPDLDMRADGTDHFCKEDLALGDPNSGGSAMRYLLAGLALVLPVVNLVGAAESPPELELRLASTKGTQLPGEQVDVRAVLLNRGRAPAYFERNLLDSRIQMEINGEWTDCRPTLTILRGVVPDPRWQRIDPGDEALVGLGAFLCRVDSLAGTNHRDWSEVPGDYKLKVTMSHRMLEPHELERSGPAPDGARAWTVASNVINLSVDEPSGVNAEALQWAREHGHSPVSVEVATKFPTSRYGALVVWRLMTIRDGDPEQVKDYMARGFYPGRSSVPDPSSPNGQRVVSAGEDMARWRIEQGERLLREQANFPYERDVRLSIAVSYAVLGNKEKATQLLKALAEEEGVLESVWARRFLALQRW